MGWVCSDLFPGRYRGTAVSLSPLLQNPTHLGNKIRAERRGEGEKVGNM